MTGENAIDVTNELIVHVWDSVDGYRTAAESSANSRLASQFAGLARKREGLASEMQARVRSLGATPEDEGSLAGMAHRAFLKLRDAVAGDDDKAVITEVFRGEDYLKGRFDMALEKDSLDIVDRTLVAQWREQVLADQRAIEQWPTLTN